MSLFNWSKKLRVKDLTADEMVPYANQILRASGRNQNSYRLIYQSLVLDPFHPEALLRLAEFFDDARTQHKPDVLQQLSALILDYALGSGSISRDKLISLQKLRLKLLWSWGYAKPTNPADKTPDKKTMTEGSSTYDIDEEGFLNAVSQAAAPYRSFSNAYISAHTIIGVKGEILVPKGSDDLSKPWEITRANHAPATAYEEWLSRDSSYLNRSGVS